MAYFVLLLVSGLLVQCYGQNSYYFENNKYCNDLSPAYGDINLDQISGVWYGVEKIQHSQGENRIDNTQDCFYIDIKEQYIQNLGPTHDFDEDALLGMWYIREYIYHKKNVTKTEYNPYCPIVQIRKFEDYVHGGLITHNLPTPPTPYPQLTNSPYFGRSNYGFQEQYRIRHFVVEWYEGIRRDDYHVKVNTSSKGFWPTGVPDGSVEYMYRFFGGLIQVLKVANNHLVLNFCMRLPHSQLYSVVLSRNENQLTPQDLASIHNVFAAKHLSTSSLKRVCDNSATSVTLSSVLILAIALLTIWRSRA